MLGSLVTVSKELSKYKLDLMEVQEIRWESSGTEPAGEYTLLYGKGNENHEWGTGLFVHKRIISAVKSVEFVSDRMSYIILRGRWCHIIVLNVCTPRDHKIDHVKENIYKEIEMDTFPKYHMKILIGDSMPK
jgi:hypothetical protein